MEKPNFNPETPTLIPDLQVLPPSSSGRRSSASNSSEFEFWMVGNPSSPQPQLLSADELFVDGVILPLHLLPQHSDPPDPEEHKADSETLNPETETGSEPGPGPGPQSSTVSLPELSTGFSASKRWKDIFKIGEKRTTTATSSSAGGEDREKDKDKEKKKERKSSGGNAIGAELNINIWPFSRSRSAGNGGNRPKLAMTASRKVSSAPCSRSNSAGESKSRRWPSSPGRVGVHLGRTSPVWKIRRGISGGRSSNLTAPVAVGNVDKGEVSSSSEPVIKTTNKMKKKETKETRRNKNHGGGGGSRARVLNLNVPMCIGYRQHLSCRTDENGTVGGSDDTRSSDATGNGGNGVSLLNLRTMFSKKVVY